MSAPLHRVFSRRDRRKGDAAIFEGRARGLTRAMLLDRSAGSVHVGYSICELPTGALARDPEAPPTQEGMRWHSRREEFAQSIDRPAG